MNSSVFHLLPSLSIGGAETLVLNSVVNINKKRKYYLVFYDSVDENLFEKLSLSQKQYIILFSSRFKVLRYFKCIIFIYKNRSSPIITSLWRSALLVYVCSIFFHVKSHIAFIHRSTTAHFIDKYFRIWQINHCLFQIADSLPAKKWILNNTSHPKVYELPLLFRVNVEFKHKKMDLIKFCFVGRLSKVKNIKRVLDMMLRLHSQIPNSSFDFYGPDQGELSLLSAFIKENCLYDIIRYKGVLMPWEIKSELDNYHYIISLSHTEGMAMSIAEAMQLGTVPIVGNVGGPSHYCQHGINSFVVSDYSDDSLDKVVQMVSCNSRNPDEYTYMSKSAYTTFQEYDYYEDEFEKLLANFGF